MKRLSIILFFITTLFFYSCENFEWFKSEKGIKKEIEGKWFREFLTDTTAQEYWTFSDGKINVFKYDLAPYNASYCNSLFLSGDTMAIKNNRYKCDDDGVVDINKFDGNDTLGNVTTEYTIDAGITTSYIKTNSLSGDYNQDLKWSIVILDKDALYLVAKKINGEILQREFEKK